MGSIAGDQNVWAQIGHTGKQHGSVVRYHGLNRRVNTIISHDDCAQMMYHDAFLKLDDCGAFGNF